MCPKGVNLAVCPKGVSLAACPRGERWEEAGRGRASLKVQRRECSRSGVPALLGHCSGAGKGLEESRALCGRGE